MSQPETYKFAAAKQAYYPGQAYNTPAMLELATLINATDGHLLDIGCGDGQLLRFLNERFPATKLAGLTVSEEERIACGDRFDVRVGDMHSLPWHDATFDTAVSRHCLEHSISPLNALFEANRVLRLDGLFHVVVPAPVSEWVIKWQDHFSVLPRAMWEKLFGDSGFAVEQYEEGSWLASFSMQRETELRFTLRKVRDAKSGLLSSQHAAELTMPSMGTPALAPVLERRIVVVLHNLVLFDAIRPVVMPFGNDVKFLIPLHDDPGFAAMATRTCEVIAAAGFDAEIIGLPADIRCDIELSPYPYTDTAKNTTQAKWRVRFMYGLAKEAWNFSLRNNAYYDFVLAYGNYDARVISAYSTPVQVGNPAIEMVQRKGANERPVLLYLPTYGPTSSIEAVSRMESQLKQRFRVIAKAHHGTTYLEPDRVALLQSWVDDLAHHDTSLSSLLARADVVLSDGSGAIFDAIAARVPVAVFRDKVFSGLDGSFSIEERLVGEGLVCATNCVSDVPATLDRAMQVGTKPFELLRKELFVALGDEAAKRATAFLSELLNESARYNNFAAARRQLLAKLNESSANYQARQIAEHQLGEIYRNLTDRLLADVQKTLAMVSEREQQIAAFNQAATEREQQIAALRQAAAERECRLAKLRSSVSWRITLPLRFIKALIINPQKALVSFSRHFSAPKQ
jgi:SAM-dependent methyltransferase